MSYRVEYKTVSRYCRSKQESRIRLILLTLGCSVLFLALTVNCWPEGNELLKRLWEQLHWEETRLALETMAGNLEQGLSAREAVTAFCRQLMEMGLQYAA